MNETYVTVTGNLVADPEEKVTAKGSPMITFRIASTIRAARSDGNGYEDIATSYYRIAAFNNLALNAGHSLRKGQPVVVYGRQQVNEFDKNDGSRGHSIEIRAFTIGPDLNRGWTSWHKGVHHRDRADDPMNDPAVQQARATGWGEAPTADTAPEPPDLDESDTGPSADARSDQEHGWRTDYVEVDEHHAADGNGGQSHFPGPYAVSSPQEEAYPVAG